MEDVPRRNDEWHAPVLPLGCAEALLILPEISDAEQKKGGLILAACPCSTTGTTWQEHSTPKCRYQPMCCLSISLVSSLQNIIGTNRDAD